MPKRCAITGCDSGSETKRPKSLRAKEISLFSTPTSLGRLEIWNDALVGNRRKLTFRDVVCSKHFRREDIDTHFVTVLADGTKHAIERERYRLKAGAVPINLANDAKPTATIEQGPADSDSAIENAAPSRITKTVDQSNRSTTYISSTVETSDEYEDLILANDDTKIYDVKYVNAYSIESLAWDLKSANWRGGWVWWCEDSSIEFAQFDRTKMQPRVRCRINESMKFTLSVGDKSATGGMDFGTIRSFDDVVVLLDKMEGLKPCAGTGNMTETRAAYCSVFLTDPHRGGLTFSRCPSCRALRRRLIERRPKNCNLKRSEIVKRLRALKKNQKTLRKAASELKSRIEEARRNCNIERRN